MARFLVLGPLEVMRQDTVVAVGGPRQRLVLACLLVHANRVVSADQLIDAVWGEQPPHAALNTLQSYVSRLRGMLGEEQRIEGRPPGYLLHVAVDELDSMRFEAATRQARAARAGAPERALALLERALGWWRGRPYADLGDQRWLAEEAGRLESMCADAREQRVEIVLDLDQAGAADEAAALVAENPLRERRWYLLMQALYRAGRQADALAAYRRVDRLLADELGLEPSPEIRRLHQGILRQDPALLVRARRLRGYRLEEEIGSGALGVVYRAVQPPFEREVAVKVIRPELADDPRFFGRFEAEAERVSRLDHPRIVPIYDYWREAGGAYLVMRWLRGGSLADALARQPVDPGRAVTLAHQLTDALAAAHRQGVVHGDVKPANVLLDEAGDAYLSDFSVAGEGSPTASATRYRSPERRPGTEPTAEADVYSVGVLLEEMLAGSDVPPRLAAVVRRATASGLAERYRDAGSLAGALRTATGPDLAVPRADVPALNPYKGLQPFREADTADFFGREALTATLAGRILGGDRLLALVGPSGSGKSSVVRAGLLPVLRQSGAGWLVVDMVPGPDPLLELRRALLRVAVDPPDLPASFADGGTAGAGLLHRLLPAGDAPVLVLIDQFERLFGADVDEDRRHQFLSVLAGLVTARGRLRVLITLRADRYDRPLGYPGFAELFRSGVETVLPLTPDEIERAVTRPAGRAGVGCDPALVAEVVADVLRGPGSLPLVQFALTELFEQRHGSDLTAGAYQAIGGIAGAVAQGAEEIYAAASQAGRHAIRQAFLRLVTVGEPGERARRVARLELDTLDVDQRALEEAIAAFGERRLLSFDRDPSSREPTVEMAHEALLHAWGRLRTWIDAARSDVSTHRRLAAATAEWEASGRDRGSLLRGSRLDLFRGWAATSDLVLARAERDYLQASTAQRDSERAAEAARLAREAALERRSIRRLRSLVAVLTVAAVTATGLTIYAFDRRRDAQAQSVRADARRLAALALVAADLDESLLLAREAVALDDSADTRGSLLAVLARSPAAVGIVHLGGDAVRALDVSPRGDLLAAGYVNGTMSVHDVRTRARLGEAIEVAAGSGPESDVTDVAFSPDGSLLAAAAVDGRVGLWDARTGTPRHALRGPPDMIAASFTFAPDRRTLAAVFVSPEAYFEPGTGDAFVARWRADSGAPIGEPVRVSSTGGDFLVYTAHGAELALVNGAEVAVLDAATLARRRSFALPPAESAAYSIAASPVDPATVALGTSGGEVQFMSLVTGERTPAKGPRHRHWVSVAFAPDGRTLASGGGGSVSIWDVASGAARETFDQPVASGPGPWVKVAPDGRTVYSAAGKRIVAWDLAGARRVARPFSFPATDATQVPVALSRDSATVAVAAGDHAELVEIRRLADLEPAGKPIATGLETVQAIAFSPDGSTLAVGGEGAAGPALIDAGSGTVRHTTAGGHDGGVYSLRFSPDGRRLLSGGLDDGRAIVWDVATGRAAGAFRQAGNGSISVDWNNDGTLLATAGYPGEAVVWRASDGSRLATLKADSLFVAAVTFSPDGSTVVAGGLDRTASFWQAASGRRGMTIAHPEWVVGLSFAPAGNLLATSTRAGPVRLWDATTGTQFGPGLPGPAQPANIAQFTADGRYLVAVYGSGAGLVWDMDPEQWNTRACAIAGRSLTRAEQAELLPGRPYHPACG